MAKKKATNPPPDPTLPRFADLTAAEYHADRTAYGRSALWTFHESRREFEGEVLLGTAPKRKKKKVLDIGTMCHYGLLEPEKFPTQYAIFPAEVLAKVAGKPSLEGAESTTESAKFREANEAAGKIVLKQSEFEQVRVVVESVRDMLDGLGWLKVKSRREQAVFWTEPTTGLPCKTLLDWLIDTPQVTFVIDFKTAHCSHPKAFRNACEDHGYWLQDSHYSEGAAMVTGKPVEFLFIVGETNYPYRPCVQRLRPEDREAAAVARRRIMAELSACLKSGDFSEPWEHGITDIDLRPSCFA